LPVAGGLHGPPSGVALGFGVAVGSNVAAAVAAAATATPASVGGNSTATGRSSDIAAVESAPFVVGGAASAGSDCSGPNVGHNRCSAQWYCISRMHYHCRLAGSTGWGPISSSAARISRPPRGRQMEAGAGWYLRAWHC